MFQSSTKKMNKLKAERRPQIADKCRSKTVLDALVDGHMLRLLHLNAHTSKKRFWSTVQGGYVYEQDIRVMSCNLASPLL